MASKKSTAASSNKKAPPKKTIQSNVLNNLEAFTCLWLDDDVANTEDNRETEQKLREFINHLRTFNIANEYRSLEYYDKCLCIQQKILPENHPYNASIYNNNISVLFETKTKMFSEALKCYQKSVDTSRKILPPQHPEILRTQENIKRIKSKKIN